MTINISGNKISNSNEDGIRITGDLDLVINENTIENSGRHGINIQQFDPSSLDEETKRLLNELKDALNNRDAPRIKKIFGAIVDKGIDVAIAIAAGLVFR